MIKKRKRRTMDPEAALMGIPESQRAPKLGIMDKLGALGGLMTDFSGNTSGAFAMHQGMNRDKLAQLAQQQAADKRAKLIQQAMGGAGGMRPAAAPGGVVNPSAAAMWQLDPASMIAHRNAMMQQAAKPMTVSQGDSVWQNGGFAGTADQSWQNGDQIITRGGDGAMSHYSAGPNAGDMVDMRGQDVTARGDQLNYDLGMTEDATKRFGHEVTDRGNTLGYKADIYGSDVSAANSMRTAGTAANRLAFDREKMASGGGQPEYSASEIKGFRDRASTLEGVGQSVGHYAAMVNEDGLQSISHPFNRDERAKMGAAHTAAQMDMKELMELGVLSGPDLQLLNEMLPPPGANMTDKAAQAKVQEVQAYIDRAKARVPEQFRPAFTGGAGGGQPVQVTSAEQMARLPSGTRFVAPDGSIRVKP